MFLLVLAPAFLPLQALPTPVAPVREAAGIVREGPWVDPIRREGGIRWWPFPDVDLTMDLESVRPGQQAGRIYEFRVQGEPEGWGRWVVQGSAVVVDVVSPRQGTFSARWGENSDAHVVRQIDRAVHGACAGHLAAPRARQRRSAAPSPLTHASSAVGIPVGIPLATHVQPGLLIDVLVVHTPGVRQAAGGASAVAATAESYIAYTNAAYKSSGVQQRVRLVAVEETPYNETLNILTDLVRLRNPNDGFLDAVHPLRDTVAADIVVLLVDAGAAGTAYLMDDVSPSFESSAFAVVRYDAGGLPFAHELGHIMGAGHNNGPSVQDAAFCFSYGHRTPGNQWRTVMSSPPGQFVDFFSTPDRSIGGVPLGVSGVGCPTNGADSVRTFNATAAVVAKFR